MTSFENMVRVWEEDDAIPRSHPDYEGVCSAYERISEFKYQSIDVIRKDDYGDEFHHHMSNGWVVVMSGAGNSRIYKPMVPSSPLCHDNKYTFGVVNTFIYTNHRKERAIRRTIPLYLEYGSHKGVCPSSIDTEDQWLLVCFDLDKNAIRHFALKHIEPR